MALKIMITDDRNGDGIPDSQQGAGAPRSQSRYENPGIAREIDRGTPLRLDQSGLSDVSNPDAPRRIGPGTILTPESTWVNPNDQEMIRMGVRPPNAPNPEDAARYAGANTGSTPSAQHMADTNSAAGAIGAANALEAQAGRGSRAGVERFRLMKTEDRQFAEGGRRFDAGQDLQRNLAAGANRTALDVANATGRWQLMGAGVQAAGGVAQAQQAAQGQQGTAAITAAGNVMANRETAQAQAAQAREQRQFEAGRPVNLGGGSALLPNGQRSDPQRGQSGLRKSEVDGVYYFTDESGNTSVQDLRQREQQGRFDMMRYMNMLTADPAAAKDYLLEQGAFAPQVQQGRPAAGAAPSGGITPEQARAELERRRAARGK